MEKLAYNKCSFFPRKLDLVLPQTKEWLKQLRKGQCCSKYIDHKLTDTSTHIVE